MTHEMAIKQTGEPAKARSSLSLLLNDKAAMFAAAFLVFILLWAIFGPFFLTDLANGLNLRRRNAPPFSLEHGWTFVLGADSLGRSMLARMIVAARTTISIAVAAAALGITAGTIIGMFAGYVGGWVSALIMRLADIVISFPGLLLALVVLYIVGPSVWNLVFVLAIGVLPLYIRTARAETLEVRERMYVSAARTIGVKTPAIIFRHILPMVSPTIITVGSLNIATLILSESGLSFLGLGVQLPDFTWGAMVASGREYLSNAWWISFWPGLLIITTTISLNVLANWVRVAADPKQRWRLEIKKGGRK